MDHGPENPERLPSSFVVRMSERSHIFYFCLPAMWLIALITSPSMRSMEPLNLMINLFIGVVYTLWLRIWWLTRTPIIVDRSGIWQFEVRKPNRVLIPWEDVITARPVSWLEKDTQAEGVLLELTASSTWPGSIGYTHSDMRKHISTFIDDPIPSNPVLLTAHYSEYDTQALASYISRVAGSKAIQMTLDYVVKT